MADFVQTIKDWRRMCKNRRCDTCRLEVNGICNTNPESRTDEDIIKIENIVTEWAAEHPEPVYPTWAEWLQQQRVLDDYHGNVACLNISALHPIPADIAQKLGIEPKEDI